MNDLRVELRFKNATLYNALKDMFEHQLPKTQHGHVSFLPFAAKKLTIGYITMLNLLSLRKSPWNKKTGNFTATAETLSFKLSIPIDELFPAHLYSGAIPNLVTRDVDGQRFVSLQEARELHLLPESTEDRGDIDPEMQIAIKDAISKSLHSLSRREEWVLKMRFGIGEEDQKSLEEVGQVLGVSPERVRQMEARALRHLRAPWRAQFFKSSTFRPRFETLKKFDRGGWSKIV